MKIKTMFICLTVCVVGFVSTRAQSWVKSDAPTNIYSYSIASSMDGTKLAASTYADGSNSHPGVIYLSSNSGLNWTQSSAPTNYWYGITGSTNGNKLAAIVQSGGIWLSTNSGASWTNSSAPVAVWYAIASSSGSGGGGGGSSGTIVAVAGGSDRFICVSTNGGLNWTNTSAPTNEYWFSVACSADGKKMVAVSNSRTNGGAGAIYTSTNSGSTWRSNNVAGIYWTGVASSADGNKLVAVAPNQVYLTSDAGGTWTPTASPNGYWYSVVCSADGSRIVLASYPAVYTSSDFGQTWVSNNLPIMSWGATAISYDGNKIAAGGYAAGIYVEQTTPALNFVMTPTNLTFAWPAPSTGFGLQETTNLATTNWLTITNIPVVTNWQNQVLLQRTNGNHFFRLKF